MADNKVTRSRKRRKEPPYRRVLRFPEVRGKVIDLVELGSSPDDYTIEIRFQDKTALTFGIEPALTPFPNWPTGKLTNTRQSNAGDQFTADPPQSGRKTEPAKRRV